MAGAAVQWGTSRGAGLVALAVLVGAIVVTSPPASPEVGAEPPSGQECQVSGDGGGHPQVRCPLIHGDGGGDGSGSGGGGGGTGERPECVWVAFELSEGVSWTNSNGTEREMTGDEVVELLDFWDVELPPEGEDVQWWRLVCGNGVDCPPGPQSLGAHQVCSAYDTRTSWTRTEEPVASGVPAESHALSVLWTEVSAQLEVPEPVLNPAEGDPAIVQVPTFAAVENPPGDGDRTNCVAVPGASVCIRLSWESSMWYEPGDGTGRIPCEPPGTRYDPGAGSPREQTGPGTCTHVYGQHTTAGGYLGGVGFAWDFTWSSSTGFSGSFDTFERVTPFVRHTDEVQSVVTDVEVGG